MELAGLKECKKCYRAVSRTTPKLKISVMAIKVNSPRTEPAVIFNYCNFLGMAKEKKQKIWKNLNIYFEGWKAIQSEN